MPSNGGIPALPARIGPGSLAAPRPCVDLLGPVRVRREGVQLDFGPSRGTAVLAVLALHAGRVVSLEQLVAAAWGDDPPASATGNIYTYVSALRRRLEPARDRYADGEVLTSRNGTYCLHLPPDAVDVARFEALRESSRRYRAAGDRTSELNALEAALGLWRGEALPGVPGPFAAAQRLRLAELRVATVERRDALRDGPGPGRAAPCRSAGYPLQASLRTATARPAPDGPSLVGRDAEVKLLRDAVAEVAAGRGRSIRVEGGPGMGKSALLAYAVGAATVGTELSQRVPLRLLAECLESSGADRRAAQRLNAIADQAPDRPTEETVYRAIGVVREAATESPLTLVADDVHWADPLSLRVWSELRAHRRDLPLLLIAAARPGATSLSETPADDIVTLSGLSDEAATALVEAHAFDPASLRRLLADAGGNPAYLRLLAEAGPEKRPATEIPALVLTVGAHLAPFSERTRHLLRAVALLEHRTVAELAAATGCDADEVVHALAPAVSAHILAVGGGRLSLRHRVVSRVLRDSIPAGLREATELSFARRLGEASRPAATPRPGHAERLAATPRPGGADRLAVTKRPGGAHR